MGDRIRHVFFDLGGTILDLSSCYLGIVEVWRDLEIRVESSPMDLLRSWEKMGREGQGNTLTHNRRAVFQISVDAMMKAMESLGIPGDSRTASRFTEGASQAIRKGAKPFPDASPEVFRDIRSLGYLLGIITDADPDLLDDLLPRVPCLEQFDPVITSWDVGVTKPHPRIFMRALEASRCSPRESAFVGDTPADVKGARAVGMMSVVVDRSQAYPGTPKPDMIVNGLDALPEALRPFRR